MNAKASAAMVTQQTKDWSDYSTGIAWGTVALFICVVFGYTGLLTAIYTDAISLTAGMFISTLLVYLGFTVAHEAGHSNIAHETIWMKPIERLMGWSLTIPFMILPFGLFAKIHDYHHAFTNDPDRDPDHWLSGGTWLNASFRAPALALSYIYLTATRFKGDPVITQTHKSSLVYYAITLSLVVGLIGSGYGLELLMVGIIPVFLASYVLGMLFDWIPHKPTHQQGRYQNTRSYLFPGLKYLTMGQNYHHIHHLYPRVSWYNYERVFKLIRPELEVNNAPIETLFSNTFSRKLPSFGKSINALEPSSIDGVHKLTLHVESIQQETSDSVAITFANLNEKSLPFKAGQYITVTKYLSGESVTRCYSIFESPCAGKLSIGVKRVKDGLLSNYLNNELAVGDELSIAGPFGHFTYDPVTSKTNKLLTLIAGGSGITPILSIAKTALAMNSEGEVQLIYANQSIIDVMFLSQINELSFEYPERFSITYIYKKGHAGRTGGTGNLNKEKLINMLAIHSKPEDAQYYICGPDAMKNIAVSTLDSLNIKNEQVFIEEFSQSSPKPEGSIHQVSITLANGSTHSLSVAENQTVLQAATQKGVKIPHACGVGQCGCCMMQVTKGKSELASDETPGLLPGEQARGLTLACQCRPKSALYLTEGNTPPISNNL